MNMKPTFEITPFPKWRGPRNAAAQMDEVELQAWQSRMMYADLREYMARRFPNARHLVSAEVLLTMGAQSAALAGVKADEVWTYTDEAMAAPAPADVVVDVPAVPAAPKPKPKPKPRPPRQMPKLVKLTASTGEVFPSVAAAVEWLQANGYEKADRSNVSRASRQGRVSYGRTWEAEYE